VRTVKVSRSERAKRSEECMKKIYSKSFKRSAIDDKHQRILNEYGAEKIDEFTSGPYELYLMKDKYIGYQIALQTESTQFADIEQQNKSIPMNEKSHEVDVAAMRNKLAEWISKYGVLKIASHNSRKTRKYTNIMRGFGFPVSVINMFGTDVISIG
jgi:hypothetical protein